MNKGDLFPWDSSLNKFITDVLIDSERRILFACIFLSELFQRMKFGTVKISCRSFCRFSFGCGILRCGKVAENELCQLVSLSFVPYTMNVVNTHIDFAHRIIWQIRIDYTLVKTELSSVGSNAEHIVNGWIDRTRMNGSSSFREFLYHCLLYFGRLCHNIVIDRRRCWQIELIGGLDVCRFFE